MQSVSSRIWTRIVVSISYDDNHYTTGTMAMKEYSILLRAIAELSDAVAVVVKTTSMKCGMLVRLVGSYFFVADFELSASAPEGIH